VRLGHRRAGTGRPLICHPGGPGFSARYLGELAGLASDVELVLVDPRGTGASPRPEDPRAYATGDYVADLEELRVELGLEQLDLLGHSHGGVVAAAYAAAHPTRVRRLVLASTLARFQAEQEAAMEQAMARSAGEPWYEDARAALAQEQAGDFATDEELGELAARELPFYFARYGERERAYHAIIRDEVPNGDTLRLFNEEIVATFDLRPDLARIEAPTLVITGELDFITGPLCAAELAVGIPDATAVVLPGVGHFIFVEAPDRFREEVARWLG
jgi:pimeloyl-ACP methyl ester carboxylesterase